MVCGGEGKIVGVVWFGQFVWGLGKSYLILDEIGRVTSFLEGGNKLVVVGF